MSIDDLKADLATNIQQAKSLDPLSTVGDLVNHINNVMWPFIENAVTELEDVDEGLSDLFHGAEDILQPETGKVLAAVIVGAAGLIGELERRLVPGDALKLVPAIREWKKLAEEASNILAEIVVVPVEGDEDDDEDDEDGEDDEDDDDSEEKT